jgi:hypothetical protein
VELACEHGVSLTAQALHLEYGKLKRLLEAAGGVKKSRAAKARAGPRGARFAARPAFVELMTTPAAGVAECVIELEGRRGKVRIQWKGTTTPDLAGLSRAWWESK